MKVVDPVALGVFVALVCPGPGSGEYLVDFFGVSGDGSRGLALWSHLIPPDVGEWSRFVGRGCLGGVFA